MELNSFNRDNRLLNKSPIDVFSVCLLIIQIYWDKNTV